MSEPSAAAVKCAEKLLAERLFSDHGNLKDCRDRFAIIIDDEFKELVEVVKELVADGECYCADWVATKGPCGHCRAKAALALTKGTK